MTEQDRNPPDNSGVVALDRAGRVIGAIAGSRRAPVLTSVSVLIVISWMFLAAMALRVARSMPGPRAGPGGDLVRSLPDVTLPQWIESFIGLCLAPAPPAPEPAYVLAAAAMWLFMALAMMLPSAVPMIRTYCEIADTAARKGEHAIHPLVLVGGYLAVWLAFSALFGVFWSLSNRLFAPDGAFGPFAAIPAASALTVAGLYQFSDLKEACLRKCGNPFAVLFANWSTRWPAIFRLGMWQGAWCVGCCWALMLVLLAVGVMNLMWMALLTVLAVVEKARPDRFVTRISGAILLVWAAGLLLLSA